MGLLLYVTQPTGECSFLKRMWRKYLMLAEEKTEEARKMSEQSVLDIDDLDNLATPEE